MRINCPFCGERDLHEFVYQGDAKARRPGVGRDASVEQFVEAVYFLDNPSGAHTGLWRHRYGCRSWLMVTRDTRSHEIVSVAFAKPAEA
jgi:methylglutamate dehydrogenase subunit B